MGQPPRQVLLGPSCDSGGGATGGGGGGGDDGSDAQKKTKTATAARHPTMLAIMRRLSKAVWRKLLETGAGPSLRVCDCRRRLPSCSSCTGCSSTAVESSCMSRACEASTR